MTASGSFQASVRCGLAIDMTFAKPVGFCPLGASPPSVGSSHGPTLASVLLTPMTANEEFLCAPRLPPCNSPSSSPLSSSNRSGFVSTKLAGRLLLLSSFLLLLFSDFVELRLKLLLFSFNRSKTWLMGRLLSVPARFRLGVCDRGRRKGLAPEVEVDGWRERLDAGVCCPVEGVGILPL